MRPDAAVWRKSAGHLGLFSGSGRLAHGIYELRSKEMTEAPGTHNPQFLPPGLPVPEDACAARHLLGAKLPDWALPATDGAPVNLSRLRGRTVIYIYPRTGVPGVDPATRRDHIPRARGRTTHA